MIACLDASERLHLGTRAPQQIEGRGFVDGAWPGDVVSIHWDWAYEVLRAAQEQLLERHFRRHLTIANGTL
jgi:hypothetical protein